MAVCPLALLQYGNSHYGSAAVASTMAMTAFAACRIVGGFESRSPTGSILTVATFNSRQMNWISLFEVVLLIFVVTFDLLNRWLGTTGMTETQWALALAPAAVLFVLWELGKLIARGSRHGAPAAAADAPAAPDAPQAASAAPQAAPEAPATR
jgi:Ca2+-transporting ATPase